MCDNPESPCSDPGSPFALSRRGFLTRAGVAAAFVAGRQLISPATAGAYQESTAVEVVDVELHDAVTAALRPDIVPRGVWSEDLLPVGELEAEASEDVRFILCHHTAQPNGYSEASIDRYLRDIYTFHTAPTKGWPDIAYNFLVDRFGTIWEGRTGSIDAPIKGSATGGSQGFALLCCWIGNHHEEPPSAEARESMEKLLAWLAHTYDIDTAPGARADFVSRGSQLHPKGREVSTRTISGHRDMSATVCPGDFAYPMIVSEFPTTVTTLRNAALTSVQPAPTTTAAPVTTTTTTTTVVATTNPPTTVPEVAAPSLLDDAPDDSPAADVAPGDQRSGPLGIEWPAAAAIVVTAATIGAATYFTQREDVSEGQSQGPQEPLV